ncbi:MSMEG_0567/Sll0786 family nitrogen starvation N-acetyltransferase [Pseudonocardia sp. N23]|uniref:MSMEG_0567/Sll0786 family nitrogen starvation N-acetyltransferase n=1 Tax=Pseudonocardia sp. N23 TaxID=1987376 RepID=UPI000C028691|nr:MSMEG_0567/Sll0786 family nitrogen starvation N-acetyltransferase [Pseudonocardia sp. N23]GAY12992.1 histone acetyltransferase HPA2 [Pseudonocardia sp. N23]
MTTTDITTGTAARRPGAGAPRPRLECKLAADDADLAYHHAIRRSVFVLEQHVFARSDHDIRDDDAATMRIVGYADGEPAGTVRLYPLDPGEPTGDWQGDRLAVLLPFRSTLLGLPLVRAAVSAAAARGGSRMIAHVQPANRTFFRRLGWTQIGEPEVYLGLPHLLMEIDLVAARAAAAARTVTG